MARLPGVAGLPGAAGPLVAEHEYPGLAVLLGLALSLFLHDLLRWLTRASGWAECYLGVPHPVARQLGRAGRFLIVSAALTLLPAFLIDRGLIAADGRLLSAPSFSRLLILAFEVSAWGVGIRLLSGRSPMLVALAMGEADRAMAVGGSRIRASMDWVRRHRRAAAFAADLGDGRRDRAGRLRLQLLGPPAGIGRVADGDGPRRMRLGVPGVARLIDRRVASWAMPRRRRSWAAALTTAMARRAASRTHKADDAPDPAESAPRPEDLAVGLRRLVGCALAFVGFLAVAWLWELDLAFVRFVWDGRSGRWTTRRR